jgi:spermidine/putrescine transport system substrate-binding protein
MLSDKVASANFAYTGYQPPLRSITASKLVADGMVPEALASAVVLPETFERGLRSVELPPAVDAAWQAVWQRFKAGS